MAGWVAGTSSSWNEADHSAGHGTHGYHAPIASPPDSKTVVTSNAWIEPSFVPPQPAAVIDNRHETVPSQLFGLGSVPIGNFCFFTSIILVEAIYDL